MSSPADTAKLEKIVLSSVIKALDKKPATFTNPGWELWIYVAQGSLIGLGFHWLTSKYRGVAWLQIVEPLFPFLLGAFMVYMIFGALLKAQRAFLKPFIDRTGVEARLRELGP